MRSNGCNNIFGEQRKNDLLDDELSALVLDVFISIGQERAHGVNSDARLKEIPFILNVWLPQELKDC